MHDAYLGRTWGGFLSADHINALPDFKKSTPSLSTFRRQLKHFY